MKDQSNQLRYTTLGNIYKWTEKGKGWTETEITDLIQKEFVIDFTKSSSSTNYYEIDRLVLTQKFLDEIFIDCNFAFEEIFELYPDSTTINGQVAFLKGVDPDEVAKQYTKAIKGSVAKHNEVKELIVFGKQFDLIKHRIDRFVTGRIWEGLKTLRDEQNFNSKADDRYKE
jgi:hypothetical protein